MFAKGAHGNRCSARRTGFVSRFMPSRQTSRNRNTYGLGLQMQHAAVSIPANIAEGFRRRSEAEKARYMNTRKYLWKRAVTISIPS